MSEREREMHKQWREAAYIHSASSVYLQIILDEWQSNVASNVSF